MATVSEISNSVPAMELTAPVDFTQSQSEYIRALEISVQLLQREVDHLRSQNKQIEIVQYQSDFDSEGFPNFLSYKTNSEVISALHDFLSKKYNIIESSIYFFNPAKKLYPLINAGTFSTLNDFVSRFEEQGIIDWAIERKTAVVIPDLDSEPETNSTGFIIIPLYLRGNSIGIFLGRTSRNISLFDNNDFVSLSAIAEHATIALDNNRSSEEIANMNLRLLTLNEQMLRSSKLASIGELTSSIAEEIDSPLKVIKGHLQLLESGLGDSERRFEIIFEQIEHISKVVGKLTEISQYSDADSAPAEINISYLVDDVLMFCNSQLQRDNIKIIKQCDDESMRVVGQKTQLEQVLLELILNSRDLMPEGGTISIGLYKVKNKWCNIVISDSGIGYGENEIKLIFEPPSSLKISGVSTGSKLFLIKNIIDQHKGSIAVASEPGKGATFKILLPIFFSKGK